MFTLTDESIAQAREFLISYGMPESRVMILHARKVVAKANAILRRQGDANG